MSPAPTTTSAPDRRSVVRWISAVVALAAAIAVVAILVWPASNAEKAREDGEQVGEAVAALYAADTSEEVDAALVDLDSAVEETADHAGDAVSEELAETEDALARAADGFVGAVTTDDAFEADLYEAELEDALNDLDDQAEDISEEAPEVEEAFWEGYEEGVSGE
jgi:hypothetical protein